MMTIYSRPDSDRGGGFGQAVRVVKYSIPRHSRALQFDDTEPFFYSTVSPCVNLDVFGIQTNLLRESHSENEFL